MRSHLALAVVLCSLSTLVPAPASALQISPADSLAIGKRVWQNECGGTVEGLTSWNHGESFASLGIGHFIWYPKGQNGPFKESFPELVRHLETHRINLPAFTKGDCPWDSKAEFDAARNGAQMQELRTLLQSTIAQQAAFLVMRLEDALGPMLDTLPSKERAPIESRFAALTTTRAGCFALVDYVNFKGEGTAKSERYDGEGWGLLQVLQSMNVTPSGKQAVAEFSRAAAEVLSRRVKNSPPARNESRWLKGWLSRVHAYPDGP